MSIYDNSLPLVGTVFKDAGHYVGMARRIRVTEEYLICPKCRHANFYAPGSYESGVFKTCVACESEFSVPSKAEVVSDDFLE